MKKGMKISELEEMLASAKERLRDVEAFGWNSDKGNIITFPITGVNCEGDHIELTN